MTTKPPFSSTTPNPTFDPTLPKSSPSFPNSHKLGFPNSYSSVHARGDSMTHGQPTHPQNSLNNSSTNPSNNRRQSISKLTNNDESKLLNGPNAVRASDSIGQSAAGVNAILTNGNNNNILSQHNKTNTPTPNSGTNYASQPHTAPSFSMGTGKPKINSAPIGTPSSQASTTFPNSSPYYGKFQSNQANQTSFIPTPPGPGHSRSNSTSVINKPSNQYTNAASTAQQQQQNIPLLSRKFVARRISEGETGRLKEELKCQACGKGYKHITSLAKHLWEHTPEWSMTSKLLISKHQQVQLLEAASILVSINEPDEIEGGGSPESNQEDLSAAPSAPKPGRLTKIMNQGPGEKPKPVTSSYHRINKLSSDSYLQQMAYDNGNIDENNPNSQPGQAEGHSSVPFASYMSSSYHTSTPASSKSPSPAEFPSVAVMGQSPYHGGASETDTSPHHSSDGLTSDNRLTTSYPSPQPSTPQLRHISGPNQAALGSTTSRPGNGPIGKVPTHTRSYSLTSPTDSPYQDKILPILVASNNNTSSPNPTSVPFSPPSYITDSLYPNGSLGASASALSTSVGAGVAATKKKRAGVKAAADTSFYTAHQHEHQRTTRSRRYSTSTTVPSRRGAKNSVSGPVLPTLGSSTNNSASIGTSLAIPPTKGRRPRRPSALDPPNVVSTRSTLDNYSRLSRSYGGPKTLHGLDSHHMDLDDSIDNDEDSNSPSNEQDKFDDDLDDDAMDEDLHTQKAIAQDQGVFGEMD